MPTKKGEPTMKDMLTEVGKKLDSLSQDIRGNGMPGVIEYSQKTREQLNEHMERCVAPKDMARLEHIQERHGARLWWIVGILVTILLTIGGTAISSARRQGAMEVELNTVKQEIGDHIEWNTRRDAENQQRFYELEEGR